MGCEEEVVKISKKLDKMVANGAQAQAMELLKALRDLPITLDILQKTRIGMSVNSLRKSSSDDEVITLSKVLIKAWKKLLPETASSKAESNASAREAKEKTETSNGNNSSGNPSQRGDSLNKDTPSKSSSVSKAANIAPKQTSFPADTSNSVRLKCRELLTVALKTELQPDEIEDDFENPEELGAKIEDCIFEEFGDTNMKYKNRVRSRVSNLKDVKNPGLRVNVLKGIIPPAKIAIMTADEMASDEMKTMRQKFTKEAINDHQMTLTGGTKTDLLKCGKCKKSNCTYNQVQTRSADEPMTTFVYCNNCGHRWKFC